MECIAKVNVLQKSEFHDYGVEFVVFFKCLRHDFHDFPCSGNKLEINRLSQLPWGGPRSKAPTLVVVICMVAGSLTSTYQCLLRAKRL